MPFFPAHLSLWADTLTSECTHVGVSLYPKINRAGAGEGIHPFPLLLTPAQPDKAGAVDDSFAGWWPPRQSRACHLQCRPLSGT